MGEKTAATYLTEDSYSEHRTVPRSQQEKHKHNDERNQGKGYESSQMKYKIDRMTCQ
jgi:hypothetical protein